MDELAAVCERVASYSSRSRKVALVADYFRSLTDYDLERRIRFPSSIAGQAGGGRIGGVVFSMATGAIFARVAHAYFPPHLTPLVAALIAGPIAVVGIVADLVESVLKRRANRNHSARPTRRPGMIRRLARPAPRHPTQSGDFPNHGRTHFRSAAANGRTRRA